MLSSSVHLQMCISKEIRIYQECSKRTQTIALNWIEMHSNKSHCQPYYPFPSCSYKMHFGYGSDFVNILCFERFEFFLVCCLHFVALRQRSINLFPFIPIHIVSIHFVSLSLCLSHCTIFSNSRSYAAMIFKTFHLTHLV